MQTGSTRPRKTGVGDLARKRMLDRVLALARDRGADAATNEVPFLEEVEVGLTGDEFVDRPSPEDAADHCGRLQRCLLGGGSRSMRAANTAWTESGTWISVRSSLTDQRPFLRVSYPRRSASPTSSSTKNGFPSALEDQLPQSVVVPHAEELSTRLLAVRPQRLQFA